MANGDFKDLNRRIFAHKALRNKALNMLKIENMMDIKEVLLQWFINFLIKRFLPAVLKMRIFLVNNWHQNYTKQLLESLIKEK